MSAKEKAVADAIVRLNAAGATYKILFEDKEFGTLEVVKPKLRGKRNLTAPYGTYADLYRDKVRDAKVGSIFIIKRKDIDQKLNVKNVMSAVQAGMANAYGPGASIVVVDDEKIECLRVK